MILFGSRKDDLFVFELLLGVSGIGPKRRATSSRRDDR